MSLIDLQPLDTWFFGDGRPFNQGEASQSHVQSLFPPHPSTLVGTVRAALARSAPDATQRWNGQGSWSSALNAALGNGNDLGPLQFAGPFPTHNEGEILFPVPQHLIADDTDDGWRQAKRLRPGPPMACDIGEAVRLPVDPDKSGGSLMGAYLAVADLEKVLHGRQLDTIRPIRATELWHHEPRVGIGRDAETRTAASGMLYDSVHVRLRPGVSLTMAISGLPDGWQPQSPAPCGGEHRLAHLKMAAGDLPLPAAPVLAADAEGQIRFTVTLLTPGDFASAAWDRPNGRLPGLEEGAIVAACVERPVSIGGWDSVAHRPLAKRPHLPAGSTWFCQAPAAAAPAILARHGGFVGSGTAMGFGLIVIGTWNETGD